MAETVLEYINVYGDRKFSEMPINEVDSLILCQFSYLKFDGMVPDVRGNGRAVSLVELAADSRVEQLFADVRFARENKALFDGMLRSKRFRSMKMNCYINLVEKEWETQFSAITFLLDDGTIYVAYRGTDETIVGWKEDFNMAFLNPVPGQSYAVKYLNMVMSGIHRPFYVGGHSKGGNLAVYAAMKCVPQVQKRLVKAYSMDGPGFRPEVLRDGSYEKVADKIVKIMPHSSLVGMLFETDIRYKVVESKTFGLAQHDPYSWLVEEAHFVEVQGIYEGRQKMDRTLNEWILSLDEKQLRTFVDTLYQVVSASQTDDLIAFTADWKKSMAGVIDALKEVDDETKAILQEIMKSLLEIAGLHLKQELKQNLNLKENLKQNLSRTIKLRKNHRNTRNAKAVKPGSHLNKN